MDVSQSKKLIDNIINDYKEGNITIDQAHEKLVNQYLKLIPYLKEKTPYILTRFQSKTDIEQAKELANLKIFESLIYED
ncbi:hypothetical protein P8831_25885 [Priestia megaterium]|uniref:hypothetical protein n=1 Tax=Priestia megaterium TaxID=1404 RepID=UPI002D7E3F1F|nr:hypothetical protein [Priestia megaterium]MEB4872115.1 hypothetical protein [Priestia megaterium]